MRYTAVALDFDGTIAHDSEVPPHVIDGLRRLKETGRKLMLVTRSWISVNGISRTR